MREVLSSPSEPLDTAARAVFEPLFGHDFSRVRVHADVRAAKSAQSLGALAYSVGHNVAFDAGRYAPATSAGMKLLAHELTHVVQQQAHLRTPIVQRKPAPAPGLGEEKANFPWLGRITDADPSSGFYESPTRTSSKGSLKKGTRVWVSARVNEGPANPLSGWLKVWVQEGDRAFETGWVSNERISYLSKINQTAAHPAAEKNPGQETFVLGQHGAFYFDLSTPAGRVMYTQSLTQKPTISETGKVTPGNYVPSPKLLKEQLLQQKGEQGLRQEAQQSLDRASAKLSQIQKILQQSALPQSDKDKLQAQGQEIVRRIAHLVDRLNQGGVRERSFSSMGGLLSAGLAIPMPEEVVTWPLALIASVVILLTTKPVADLDEIQDDIRSLVQSIDDAITTEGGNYEICQILYVQCVGRRKKGFVPCDDCLGECLGGKEGIWDTKRCPIPPL